MRPSLLGVCSFALLVTACSATAPESTDEDPIVEHDYAPDPDVNTFVPEGYRAEDPQRVIFLGDSITAGAGSTGFGLDYTSLLVSNDTAEWPAWDGHDLKSLFGELDVIDVSRGGARTADLISQQLPRVAEQVGDSVSGETLVVITIGGNDMQAAMVPMLTASDKELAYQEQIGPVLDDFGTIVDYFQDESRFPDGTFVYMTNVYEPTDNEGRAQGCFFNLDLGDVLPYLDRANDEMRELAEARGTASVDLRGHFLGHGHNHDDADMLAYDAPDPTLWLADDCIHPNNRGHHELRRLFVTAIDGRPLEAFGEVE